MGLILKEVDLDKTVFLMPPLPFMTYTWSEIIKLRKIAVLALLITSASLIAAAGMGSFMAFLGFIFDPEHHLRYGKYGLIPGILLLIVGVKMLFAWLKLLGYLLGLPTISK